MKFQMRVLSEGTSADQHLEFNDHDGSLKTQYELTKITTPPPALKDELPKIETIGFVLKEDIKRLARAT